MTRAVTGALLPVMRHAGAVHTTWLVVAVLCTLAILNLLRSVNKTPVVVRKDIPGQIGNRLQYALFREAVSLVFTNVAVPFNLAAGLNVASTGSTAASTADQSAPVTQDG